MRAGRPTPQLELREEEHRILSSWTRKSKCPQALALRARVVLLCAEGLSNTEVSGRLHLTLQTVGKWRQRFIEKRIEGLMDEPRTGTPKRLTEKDVDRVLELTLESTPMNARRWSTRSLAEVAGLSRASVHRIWKAFSVEPHRVEAFRMMRDSLQDKRPGA